ncbi:MAG: cell division protein FtsZ, partial [Nitratireductor sp.]|nr:cell division protein FtsZ [Nitratireductor sp.]
LLISITGGRDLTLFEVDEAATRIREEVDAEANIILGATFDEALEGVIRVSVVATGIDRAVQAGVDNEVRRPAAAIASRAPSRPVATPEAPASRPEMPRPAMASNEERVARVAEALARPQTPFRPAAKVEKDGVSIEPLQRPSLFSNSDMEEEFKNALEGELEGELMPRSEDFIPEAVETPASMAPVRMPEIEDFPPMVRAEIESRKAPVEPAAEPHRGPMGLLKKLTTGLGARETEAPAAPPQRAARPAPQNLQQSAQHHAPPQRVAAQPRPAVEPHQGYPAGHAGGHPGGQAGSQAGGHMGAAGGRVDDNPFAPKRPSLDQNGRISPASRPIDEDDNLEIPAFLRRQSS